MVERATIRGGAGGIAPPTDRARQGAAQLLKLLGMAESEPATAVPLDDRLKSLAALEPSGPVISLYLDLRPNQHGRDDYDAFVRRYCPNE